MYWKMSIDLSRPLVPSMGQHDPLDGVVTYRELQATLEKDSRETTGRELRPEILDMAGICKGKNWATDDPLGIGGLLSDAYRLAQLIVGGSHEQTDFLQTLLDSSLTGLASFVKEKSLILPARHRLAFRELGLSIGLQALQRVREMTERESPLLRNAHSLRSIIDSLGKYEDLKGRIETFWLEGINREAHSWIEHRDINTVMLATSLAPDGFLEI